MDGACKTLNRRKLPMKFPIRGVLLAAPLILMTTPCLSHTGLTRATLAASLAGSVAGAGYYAKKIQDSRQRRVPGNSRELLLKFGGCALVALLSARELSAHKESDGSLAAVPTKPAETCLVEVHGQAPQWIEPQSVTTQDRGQMTDFKVSSDPLVEVSREAVQWIKPQQATACDQGKIKESIPARESLDAHSYYQLAAEKKLHDCPQVPRKRAPLPAMPTKPTCLVVVHGQAKQWIEPRIQSRSVATRNQSQMTEHTLTRAAPLSVQSSQVSIEPVPHVCCVAPKKRTSLVTQMISGLSIQEILPLLVQPIKKSEQQPLCLAPNIAVAEIEDESAPGQMANLSIAGLGAMTVVSASSVDITPRISETLSSPTHIKLRSKMYRPVRVCRVKSMRYDLKKKRKRAVATTPLTVQTAQAMSCVEPVPHVCPEAPRKRAPIMMLRDSGLSSQGIFKPLVQLVEECCERSSSSAVSETGRRAPVLESISPRDTSWSTELVYALSFASINECAENYINSFARRGDADRLGLLYEALCKSLWGEIRPVDPRINTVQVQEVNPRITIFRREAEASLCKLYEKIEKWEAAAREARMQANLSDSDEGFEGCDDAVVTFPLVEESPAEQCPVPASQTYQEEDYSTINDVTSIAFAARMEDPSRRAETERQFLPYYEKYFDGLGNRRPQPFLVDEDVYAGIEELAKWLRLYKEEK